MRSMAGFVGFSWFLLVPFGVFLQHLVNSVADNSRQTDRAKVEENRRKMIETSVT